eukprot:4164036-Amphidinium_carterae.1
MSCDCQLRGGTQPCMEVKQKRPASNTLHALQVLWKRLGGLVRDMWGSTDMEYAFICEAFGCPGDESSLLAVLATDSSLTSVWCRTLKVGHRSGSWFVAVSAVVT